MGTARAIGEARGRKTPRRDTPSLRCRSARGPPSSTTDTAWRSPTRSSSAPRTPEQLHASRYMKNTYILSALSTIISVFKSNRVTWLFLLYSTTSTNLLSALKIQFQCLFYAYMFDIYIYVSKSKICWKQRTSTTLIQFNLLMNGEGLTHHFKFLFVYFVYCFW